MKKNNIFIVIDSLYYDKTIASSYRNNPMPFLGKLRKEGYDYTNMYSEAPYTEAALVSLLCGIDTLKQGGYMKKLYNKESIMETFQKNGYDTFCNCIQPLVYPSYSYPGITDGFYNVCYDFQSLWSYRLEFYSNLLNKGELSQDNLNLVIEFMEDNFKTWIDFFDNLKNNKRITSFIYKYIDLTDLDKNITLLNKEYKLFLSNKEKYTKELLKMGLNHPLFKIKSYNLSKKMSEEDMIKVYKKYKHIIKKMKRKTFTYNFKNQKLNLNPKEERIGLIKGYLNAVYNRFLDDKIDYHIKSKKAAPSMDTTINHFENWLLNRKSKKPYFAYIHVDDCHSKEMFYTYDTSDFKKLDEEFNLVDNYLDNLPKKYKGSISYDVSLQYADLCLKRLYTFLEKNQLLDNINIIICADHGSSYSFDPYRSNYVNNIHRENYNMPFVIWSKDLKAKLKTGLYNTKDIPATILDLNNIDIPSNYDGESTLKKDTREYVLLENTPGGCPDYNLRNFWLGIRNNKYLVVMELNIHDEFNPNKIYAIYDLENDPKELKNLKGIMNTSSIKREMEILKIEYQKLQEDIKKHNFINKN